MRTRNLSEQSFKQIMGSDYGYLEAREELVPPQVETQGIFIEGLTCSCKYSTHTHTPVCFIHSGIQGYPHVSMHQELEKTLWRYG